jgi:hypothetical protein
MAYLQKTTMYPCRGKIVTGGVLKMQLNEVQPPDLIQIHGVSRGAPLTCIADQVRNDRVWGINALPIKDAQQYRG